MIEIPKVIHYFWFGGNELPIELKKYIQSWSKYCPNFKIIEWDETNFNVNACKYSKEAYESKKWAFVSDYARLKILEENGGIYFDTDVELIKSITPILKKGAFINLESGAGNEIGPGMSVIAVPPHHPLIQKLVKLYEKRAFIKENGKYDKLPIGTFVKNEILKDGFVEENRTQIVDNITFYAIDFFSPINYGTGKKNITVNTYGIHHYKGTWLTKKEKRNEKISQFITRNFGPRSDRFIREIYHLFKD